MWLFLRGQVYGDPEKDTKYLLTSLELLLTGKKIGTETVFKRKCWTIRHIKRTGSGNAQIDVGSPEILSDCFDEWGYFFLAQDFATKNDNGLKVFSKDQIRCINNIDETNLSLDGSGGG